MSSQILLLTTLSFYVVVSVHVVLRALGRRSVLAPWALATAVAAFALHSVTVARRWSEVGRFPAVGLHDVAVFLAWTAVLVFFLTYLATRIEALSLSAFPAAFALLCVAVLSAPAERTDPIVRSLFLPLHATCAFFGFGALLVASMMGALYLIQENELKRRMPRRFYYLAPSLERCETLGGRSVAVGLTFLTMAIITGLLWSHAARGQYVSGTAKEWTAFAAWVIYVGLTIARHRSGWGGRRAAALSIAGFVAVAFIFVWVTLLARAGGAA